MTTLDLPSADRIWSSAATAEPWTVPTAESRVERLLPFLTGLCLVVLDVALVVGSFMLAHWLRFTAADDSLS
ncbi:MAG TPA: hypothetical protein VFB50_01350, partial [Chloroflexota bacterium]|nr:hypothetical protein [Chloroflexota bacterium]